MTGRQMPSPRFTARWFDLVVAGRQREVRKVGKPVVFEQIVARGSD